MEHVYDHPKYYEIAFSFRDTRAEVDTFERCFREHGGRPLRNVLEVGCGHSPHLEELLKRGYGYTGVDLNPRMLEQGARKAKALGGKAAFIQADMTDFILDEKFDFAFIALGSLYVRNTEEVFSHFHSAARALHPGGLYLLDWCIHFAPYGAQDDTWTIEREGMTVTAHYSEKPIDAAGQLIEETLTLEVLENGTRRTLSETITNRVLFPQEFLQVIERGGEFEFIGWWNNWNLDEPLGGMGEGGKISRPITLLRRR